MNNPGTITVKNDGAYIARFSIQYTINGSVQKETADGLVAGQKKTLDIPANATEISLTVQDLIYIHWHTIFKAEFESPVTNCYKVWGTIFGSKWAQVDCSEI